MQYKLIGVILIGWTLTTCAPPSNNSHNMDSNEYSHIGQIIKLDDRLNKYISANTQIELLADGFDWTEGPLWVEDGKYLLFSDIPPNSIYKWKEGEGHSLYLKPSGYTGSNPRGGEPGSNGLLLNDNGELVLCMHGDRQMGKMDAPLKNPESKFIALATHFGGMKFNSPNDAVFHSSGELYFTDPPYGLEENMNSPYKEIPFQGVYRLDNNGEIHLQTNSISRPNGIAFSPDEKFLYVSCSDTESPFIYKFPMMTDGNIGQGEIFFDASHLMKDTAKGLPDGLKVKSDGTLFATGPGGVLVISSGGEHLGTISSGEATSNCAFDTAENYLYATSDMYLIRIKLNE